MTVDTARARARGLWRGPALAVSFLTIIPVPAAALAGFDGGLGAALPWFPLVGAAVGAAGGGVRLAGFASLGRGPATVLAMVVMVGLTGALHQDALADVGDGLGVRGDRARRLAVMRDSRLGAFGVLALLGWALLLFATLSELSAVSGLRALVCAGAASRFAALLHGLLSPPARRDGLGATLGVTTLRVALALVVAAVIVGAAAGLARGGLAISVAAAVSALAAVAARRGLGGSTGDTLGATVAVGEVMVCLALTASWR